MSVDQPLSTKALPYGLPVRLHEATNCCSVKYFEKGRLVYWPPRSAWTSKPAAGWRTAMARRVEARSVVIVALTFQPTTARE